MKKIILILVVVTLFSCTKENEIISNSENASINYSIKLINSGAFYDVSLTNSIGQIFYIKKGTNINEIEFEGQSNMTLDCDCDSSFLFINGKCELLTERRIIYLN